MVQTIKNALSREITDYYVGTTPKVTGSFRQLMLVVTLVDGVGAEGAVVPAGSTGTIVAVWRAGESYEVEFPDSDDLATFKQIELRLA